MTKGRRFVCYEEPYYGQIRTLKWWKMEYKKYADKEEYPTFRCWLFDNMNVGNLVEITKK